MGTYDTQVQYKDMVVSRGDKVLWKSDLAANGAAAGAAQRPLEAS